MDFGEVPLPWIRTSGTTTRIKLRSDPPPKPGPKPHVDSNSFGLVYANDLARKAYSRYGSPDFAVFPVGSILVREKLMRSNSDEPQLLSVMIKREKGFNPDGGDWSFLITDGAATKVKQRKKKGDCLECHRYMGSHDFVFELK